MTHYGGSGDWPERPPPRRRSGRHSRTPQDHDDPGGYAAPDPYAQAGPYAPAGPRAQPDPYASAGSHAAPGGYREADLYAPADPDPRLRPYGGQRGSGAHAVGNGQAGRGGRARPANPDPYARSGPDAVPGPYDQTDPSYGRPGQGTQPGLLRAGDPLGAGGSVPGHDSFPGQGSFPGRDPLAGREPFPGRDPLAQSDPRQGRTAPQPPGRYPPGDGYGPRAPRERYAPPDNGARTEAYGPPGSYPDGDYRGRGLGRQDRYGEPARYGEQNGYGRTDMYGGPPVTRPPHAPFTGGASAYGRRRDPRGPGEERDAAPPGARDHGPFRWQPSPDASEPVGMPGVPGYGNGMDQEPARPEPGNWDPGPEPVRRRGRDDSRPAAQAPGPGPVGGRAWEDEADEPGEWEDAPARDGLIPGFGERQDFRRGRGRRPGRRVGRALAPTLAVLVALVVLVALGFGGYKIYQHFQSPDYSGPGFGEVTVQVNPGDTAESLAPRLVQLGVVASTSSFVSAVKQSSDPTGLQPGFFRMHKHMNAALAYKLLLNPASRIQSVVTIPEGFRLTQILARLKAVKSSPIPPGAFAKALKDPAALGLPSYANGNPEGYLFPATYDITPGMNATSVLRAMVTRFGQEAASVNLPAAAAAVHLTPGQVITVASLLQAEGGSSRYFSLVAEVIYNRLRAGWKLGLQSTVNYVLHTNKASLTVTQLSVPSPYNTYIHTGLPPGPIDSPGDAAIQAALHPAHGNYMYFVTVDLKTGLTKFTSSAAVFAELEAECKKSGAC